MDGQSANICFVLHIKLLMNLVRAAMKASHGELAHEPALCLGPLQQWSGDGQVRKKRAWSSQKKRSDPFREACALRAPLSLSGLEAVVETRQDTSVFYLGKKRAR